MKFTPTPLEGVFVMEPQVFTDERGFFFEDYREEIFAVHGITGPFVQDNHSLSRLGVLRGLHYQAAPKEQAKLMRVIQGQAFDVVVDIRKNSKTFGQYFSQILSAENKKILYAPAGFAHGFCALEDNTEFLYKVSEAYSPSHERGILWSDLTLAIPWPKLGTEYLLSDKDKALPQLKNIRF